MNKNRFLVKLVEILLCLGLFTALISARLAESDAAGAVDQTIQGAWIEHVGRIGGSTTVVAVQGAYLYMSEGYGLTILNISNPASPTTLGRTALLPNLINDLAVSGDYAYVLDGDLRVVDISNPDSPVEVGFLNFVGASYLAVSGNYAYVGDAGVGLHVVDISNPVNPSKVGFLGLPSVNGVAVSGSYAYVVDGDLKVVDVANPANPIQIGFLDLEYTNCVAVSGDYTYVASGNSMLVVDVSDPTNPVEIGRFDAGTDEPEVIRSVTVLESYAYITSVALMDNGYGGGYYNNYLHVVDVSNPSSPNGLGSLLWNARGGRMAVSGNYIYLTIGGLRVVDVSDPIYPRDVGPDGTLSYAAHVAVKGDYAYVVDPCVPYNPSCLRVINISNPANPIEVGVYYDQIGTRFLVISGDYAYMTYTVENRFVPDNHYILVVSIADPVNPVTVGLYETSQLALDIAISGDLAYVVDGGLRVLNVPTMDQVGSYDTPGNATGVAVWGGYAYVADDEYGLRVVDISNPANPIEVSHYDTPGNAIDVTISDSYAYLADSEAGLRVVDVSNPLNPVEVGFYDSSDSIITVAVSGNYAYVSTSYWGEIWAVDISDPVYPVPVGSLGLYGNVTTSGVYTYVAGKNAGMFILHGTEPLIDSGFRPVQDGYSFANYGVEDYPDYTIPDMQRMFGESSICWMSNYGCEVNSQALLWGAQNFLIMNGGHSYGMAVSGLRFFMGIDTPLGAEMTYELNKSSDILFSWVGEGITITLANDIGFFTASQFVEPLRSAIPQALAQTPAEVYNQLKASLMLDDVDPLILFMYDISKGHTLTPYAITSPSIDVYHVWIYDSEHPGDLERVVTFDLNANTWSYDTGNGVWSGDASSHSLGVIPTSLHGQAIECPWCTSQLDSTTGSHLLTMVGNGHLLVSDSQGRRLGYLGSEYVEEIPGGYGSLPLLSTEKTHEPVYTLPLTETYTILLDGQAVSQTAPASLWQFGPGYGVSVQGLDVGPSTQDYLTIGSNGQLLSYHASQAQEPAITLAVDSVNANYRLQVAGIDIGAGDAVILTADTTVGNLILDGSQASGGMYSLNIRMASDAGTHNFYYNDISVLAGDTHILHFGEWDGIGTILLEIDNGSDGIIDETVELENQVMWNFLPSVGK